MSARELIAGPWLAARRLRRSLRPSSAPAGSFRMLLLHDVPPAHYPALAALLDRLAGRGGFITPAAAIARLAAAPAGDKAPRDPPWLVSFDDGFASNRGAAEALLAPRAIRAVFFVCAGLIDLAPAQQESAARRAFFAGKPAAAVPPLMGWDDLAALAQAGHSIGGHTLTHPRLSALGRDDIEREVAGAAARIVDRLGTPADWFAYPFGDIGAISDTALGIIGRHWRLCRSGVRGLNAPGTHRLALHADHIDLAAVRAWQYLAADGALDGRYADARRLLAAMAAASGHSAVP